MRWLYTLFGLLIISIHAPARGATNGQDLKLSVNAFQSTLPRGERHRNSKRKNLEQDFNPRSREGSDERKIVKNDRACEFQSTLPRGERRDHDSLFVLRLEISIHAPARGATLSKQQNALCLSISIHAPARGATLHVTRGVACHRIFQSTLPRGERRDIIKRDGCGREISIHAPARGATAVSIYYTTAVLISIHAPARGATAMSNEQSAKVLISIHAPARGATSAASQERAEPRISIHAPARGATAEP